MPRSEYNLIASIRGSAWRVIVIRYVLAVLDDEAYSRRASETLEEDVLCILSTLDDKCEGLRRHILYRIHISRWNDLVYIGGLPMN
jgi:hypothetical protein